MTNASCHSDKKSSSNYFQAGIGILKVPSSAFRIPNSPPRSLLPQILPAPFLPFLMAGLAFVVVGETMC